MNQSLTQLIARIQALKRRGLVIVLGLGFVLAMIFAYRLSQRVPEGEKISKPAFSEEAEPLKGVTISGLEELKTPSLPPAGLEVYQMIEKGEFYREERIMGIAKSLGFGEVWQDKLELEEGTLYFFEQPSLGKSLTVQDTPPSISLSSSVPPAKGALPSEEQAKEKAQGVLEDLGIADLSFLAGSYRPVFVEAGHISLVLEPSEANAVELGFSLAQGNFLVLGENPLSVPASFVLDAGFDIISFRYFQPTFEFRVLKTLPLRSPNAALGDLKQDGFVVFSEALSGGDAFIESYRLTSFSPRQMFLAYYLGRDNLLQPIYVFQGRGRLAGFKGEEVWATVYLPAIEEKYLK